MPPTAAPTIPSTAAPTIFPTAAPTIPPTKPPITATTAPPAMPQNVAPTLPSATTTVAASTDASSNQQKPDLYGLSGVSPLVPPVLPPGVPPTALSDVTRDQTTMSSDKSAAENPGAEPQAAEQQSEDSTLAAETSKDGDDSASRDPEMNEEVGDSEAIRTTPLTSAQPAPTMPAPPSFTRPPLTQHATAIPPLMPPRMAMPAIGKPAVFKAAPPVTMGGPMKREGSPRAGTAPVEAIIAKSGTEKRDGEPLSAEEDLARSQEYSKVTHDATVVSPMVYGQSAAVISPPSLSPGTSQLDDPQAMSRASASDKLGRESMQPEPQAGYVPQAHPPREDSAMDISPESRGLDPEQAEPTVSGSELQAEEASVAISATGAAGERPVTETGSDSVSQEFAQSSFTSKSNETGSKRVSFTGRGEESSENQGMTVSSRNETDKIVVSAQQPGGTPIEQEKLDIQDSGDEELVKQSSPAWPRPPATRKYHRISHVNRTQELAETQHETKTEKAWQGDHGWSAVSDVRKDFSAPSYEEPGMASREDMRGEFSGVENSADPRRATYNGEPDYVLSEHAPDVSDGKRVREGYLIVWVAKCVGHVFVYCTADYRRQGMLETAAGVRANR
uniref:Uncharacterized protein n=1 Tax=Rhodosorus marinus TaxID=101924 RepID=A0A7S3EJQ9_9RHOD|mmetsp:Transcript_39149/g.155183  ORF Transcript_39149/g.155183 Transcript_39149/m.155183 type:complete len:617 (+) Transcript_39149:2-1852(+)